MERRIRVFALYSEARPPVTAVAEWLKALPSDAVFEGGQFDPVRQAWLFWIVSGEWPVVERGTHTPVLILRGETRADGTLVLVSEREEVER